MSHLTEGFKECAHQAGEVCNCTVGRLIRAFGLEDFLVNKLHEEDDAPTIAVKALAYFCDQSDPHDLRFKFAVLAVGIFLNDFLARQSRQIPQQALRDLVAILRVGLNEDQIRRWIQSNF